MSHPKKARLSWILVLVVVLVLVIVLVLEKLSKPYLVLDGGIDCEKTDGPTKQVERRGRTKSAPIDPYALRARDEDDLVVASLQTAQKVFFEVGTEVSALAGREKVQLLAGPEPQPSHQRRQGAQTQQSQSG